MKAFPLPTPQLNNVLSLFELSVGNNKQLNFERRGSVLPKFSQIDYWISTMLYSFNKIDNFISFSHPIHKCMEIQMFNIVTYNILNFQ